jgi:hypothetical protein
MKMNLPKLKRFPLATSQKKATQLWSSLLKLSVQRKRFYKNQMRFFSIEFGMSLPKRLFWQMAIPQTFQISQFGAFKKTQFKKTFSGFLQKTKSLGQPWNVFRSLFFGKMWILNHPSLVPGIVWPTKSKKMGLAKMRALKALFHLTGKEQKKFLFDNFQKIWSLSHQTKPMLWTFASSLESLRTHFLLKSGWVGTVPAAFQFLTHNKGTWNGFCSQKAFGFAYLGDFVQLSQKNPIVFDSFLSELLTYGWTKQGSLNPQTPMHQMKPFLWLFDFFKNQKKSKIFQKKTTFFSLKKGKKIWKKKKNFKMKYLK